MCKVLCTNRRDCVHIWDTDIQFFQTIYKKEINIFEAKRATVQGNELHIHIGSMQNANEKWLI